MVVLSGNLTLNYILEKPDLDLRGFVHVSGSYKIAPFSGLMALIRCWSLVMISGTLPRHIAENENRKSSPQEVSHPDEPMSHLRSAIGTGSSIKLAVLVE